MNLNTLAPVPGSRQTRKRLGRGIGSGLGKTSGKGHKGQSARAGGYHKINFEGGQMPIQRRLPKMGFTSAIKRLTEEVRLDSLQRLEQNVIDLAYLQHTGLVARTTRFVKVIQSGKLDKAIQLKGLSVSKGARAIIEGLGGTVLNHGK